MWVDRNHIDSRCLCDVANGSHLKHWSPAHIEKAVKMLENSHFHRVSEDEPFHQHKRRSFPIAENFNIIKSFSHFAGVFRAVHTFRLFCDETKEFSSPLFLLELIATVKGKEFSSDRKVFPSAKLIKFQEFSSCASDQWRAFSTNGESHRGCCKTWKRNRSSVLCSHWSNR